MEEQTGPDPESFEESTKTSFYQAELEAATAAILYLDGLDKAIGPHDAYVHSAEITLGMGMDQPFCVLWFDNESEQWRAQVKRRGPNE